jgi:hypothetical protein
MSTRTALNLKKILRFVEVKGYVLYFVFNCRYISSRNGRSGDRIPVGARFSAPVQTGPGAHPASCKMDTVSFPGVESGRGLTLTPYTLLVLRSKNRVELYLYSP